MQYAYFVGSLILFTIFLFIYWARKDLRKQILFGGILGLPFAFFGLLFVPEYWNPPSVFNLIRTVSVGIEDLIFCFSGGGIAAVIFEFAENKKTVKIKSNGRKHIMPYVTVITLIIFLEFFFPATTVLNAIIALLFGSVSIGFKRKDLITQIILGGLFFAVIYFIAFAIFNKIFPGYVAMAYTLENLWGIYILEVPLEEIVFAFAAGTFWATLYEFIKGYKTADM